MEKKFCFSFCFNDKTYKILYDAPVLFRYKSDGVNMEEITQEQKDKDEKNKYHYEKIVRYYFQEGKTKTGQPRKPIFFTWFPVVGDISDAQLIGNALEKINHLAKKDHEAYIQSQQFVSDIEQALPTVKRDFEICGSQCF